MPKKMKKGLKKIEFVGNRKMARGAREIWRSRKILTQKIHTEEEEKVKLKIIIEEDIEIKLKPAKLSSNKNSKKTD